MPGQDDCIEPAGWRSPDGYVYVKRDGKMRKAHRWVWEQANGPIPEGLCVLHSCDNPPCVNLDHLRLGTPADNAADRDRKHRRHMKLWPRDIVAIRSALANGESAKSLAARYGINFTGIYKIKRGETWKHVPVEAVD